jgi:hypothetical protein
MEICLQHEKKMIVLNANVPNWKKSHKNDTIGHASHDRGFLKKRSIIKKIHTSLHKASIKDTSPYEVPAKETLSFF